MTKKFDSLQDYEFRRDEWAAQEQMTCMEEQEAETIYDKEPWWFCQTGDHESCSGGALFKPSRFTRCPCECHQAATTQPAPDAGEWHVGGKFISDCEETLSGMYAVYNRYGKFYAAAQTREDAEQIVADHNTVARLVTALRALDNHYQASGKVWDDARAALTTTQPDTGEEPG